jgi:type VI secretion system secreted protein VgrG
MPKYVQSHRPLQLTTPLGADVLLVKSFRAREALSELFRINIDVVAELDTDVPFEKLLGQKATLKVQQDESGPIRYFSGMVSRVMRGGQEQSAGSKEEMFDCYYLELVPQFWLLSRNRNSRIFQHLPVTQVLQQVLTGIDVTYQIQGPQRPREYLVQYQESDFAFASRLMEQEGIYYFFKHSDGSHQMVVADTPQSHPPLPILPEAFFETAINQQQQSQDRVMQWLRSQEIRGGKYTVSDEHFQLPNQHLDAEKAIQDSVTAGKTTHKLSAGGASKLELYEFPGEYSRHFDDVNKSGGGQSQTSWIRDENTRVANLRMQQEAAETLLIEGGSVHSGFTAGHKFTLNKHFNDDGEYVLTSIEHLAAQPMQSGSAEAYHYENQFTCIPIALPYRPQRVTPVPSVRGVQLATVVGPSGEEIFTDKYSRVKVQFHWDREGKKDIDSSCWLRVGSFWAGKQWGGIHIPRIGQEVIVAFEEGDVDYPIVVGSVYNAEMMPPYTLPDNKTQSGVKSRSSKGGGADNFNELRFEDKKGSEEIHVQAEKDLTMLIKNDWTTEVKHDYIENIEDLQRTEAKKSIEIIVGQSSIKLEPTQITIKTVNLVVDTQVSTKMTSKMTNMESSATTTIKGGMVLIN